MTVLTFAVDTIEAKAVVWDILREECGASDSAQDFASFARAWPACGEYRFMGSLGFGGKVWCSHGHIYVTCYPEDANTGRKALMVAANKRLERFVQVNLGLEPLALRQEGGA